MTHPKAVHFLDGEWVEGNPPIMGPMTHAAWMASVVFDGARAFEGVTPDLDLHCERLVRSAERFGLPAHFSLLSEIHEAAAAILDSRVVAVVNKYPDLVEYIHVSDQYSGPKQVRVLSYYGHKQVRLYNDVDGDMHA